MTIEDDSPEHNPITPFAITNYRDIRQRFGIKQKNRRGHMYVIGKTGTGGTAVMQKTLAGWTNVSQKTGSQTPISQKVVAGYTQVQGH